MWLLLSLALPLRGKCLMLSGVESHAKSSLQLLFPEGKTEWPYSRDDLVPSDASNDQLFYLVPKFVHHAGEECRESLTKYYDCALPENGQVLDLCSSWTSHYPSTKKLSRCAVLGLNPLELVANPSKTEWTVRNLNRNPQLPYDDQQFDVVTNALSVDYLTNPLAVFREIHRVLKPGGLATMAFTNRCFPSKVVPIWLDPFTEQSHAQIVANYFYYATDATNKQSLFTDITAANISPDGWTGMRDPMIVVAARSRSSTTFSGR